MIRNGIRPRHFTLFGRKFRYTDHRDLDYHRTFGAVAQALPLLEYNYDAGFGMEDQNADGYPNGCTGYMQNAAAQDIDRAQSDPAFVYKNTLEMSGLPDGAPCDVRISMKSTVVYGIQRTGETKEQALAHRQGPFLNVRKVPGMDWFDSIRLALRNNPNRSLSLCTPWFHEWENPDGNGIVPEIFTGDPDTLPWHNHKGCGEHIIDGLPYLTDKSWQGANIGNGGYLYFGRKTINTVMEIDGTEVFIRQPIGTAQPSFVKLTIIETILSYIGRILMYWQVAHM